MYCISVGDKRMEKTIVGTIERGSGSAMIKEKGEMAIHRGTIGFPNKVQIWTQRVIDGKLPKNDKGEEVEVAVNDPKYKGELKKMKWGTNGGSLIDVRYLKGYNTLDVLYQDTRLNFKIDETNEASADAHMIQLPGGDNDIDETIEPLLVQHLQWHKYNRDSQSKDPEFYGFMFFEKNFEQEEAFESKILDEKFEARKVVDACTGGEELSKMKNLFSIVRSVTDETPEDSKMYSYLKMIADKKPSQFLKAVEEYKIKMSNVFEKLKSYNAVDLTTDGAIVTTIMEKGKSKQEILATDLPAKGEGMFDYLLANFSDPTVFDISFKLIQITDKLK